MNYQVWENESEMLELEYCQDDSLLGEGDYTRGSPGRYHACIPIEGGLQNPGWRVLEYAHLVGWVIVS